MASMPKHYLNSWFIDIICTTGTACETMTCLKKEGKGVKNIHQGKCAIIEKTQELASYVLLETITLS